MTVAEILDESRDFHGSFTKQNVPDPVCMRALSRYVRRLASKVTTLEESALAVREDVSNADLLAAATGRTGIALPAHLHLLRPVHVVRTSDGMRLDVEIADHATRNTHGAERFPAASLMAGKLYPLNLQDVLGNTSDHGWEDYDGLELMLVPLYDDLTGPTSVIGLPDSCRDAIVCNLALFMAGRSKGVLADLPLLTTQAADAETQAVNTLVDQASAATWRVGR